MKMRRTSDWLEKEEEKQHEHRQRRDVIETEGVKVNFGDFWALKGVDIKVRKGEIIVILGPSGSGKSTYMDPEQTSPTAPARSRSTGYNRRRHDRVRPEVRQVRVGFVFQQFNLFPHLTIMENVTLALMKVRGWPRGRPRTWQWSCSRG